MRKLAYFSFILLTLLNSCGETTKKDVDTEVDVENSEITETESTAASKKILFFGDSLTAAMGLDPAEGYPAEIQEKIDSLGLNYEVINAGLSGETSAGGRNRINWVLNQEVDVFVLELGANDGLRGIPVEETRGNLQAIIDIVREKNPEVKIVLAGMQVPPNLGPEYTRDFRNLFSELAEANEVYLIPFLLEGVAGDPSLNQPDKIHPTAEGYDIVAENVWEVLEPVVREQ